MKTLICRPNDIRLIEFVQEAMLMDKFVEIKIYRETRTGKQNRARWLYLEMIAQELTERGELWQPPGFDIEIPYTKDNLYENVWRVIQINYFPDVKKLNTKQFTEVAELAGMYFAKKFQISIQFPNEKDLYDENNKDCDSQYEY